MTLSSGLADIGTMVSMARVLADIPLETMQFVVYPNALSGNRVYPIEDAAEELMRRIRLDLPIELGEDSLGVGSTQETPTPTPEPGEPLPTETPEPTETPGATPTPTPTDGLEGVVGQDASQESCVVPFGG